jgi:two-component sensor histidine kinase/sensor domain CHASE-containing protein
MGNVAPTRLHREITRPLSLRKKTLLLVAASRIALIVLVYVVCRAIILGSFDDLETADMRDHVLRVQFALENKFTNLQSVTGDWAAWTDTVEFVQGKHETYIDDYLTDAAFANLRLNLMVFVDRAGEIVYAKAYDITTATQTPVPAGLSEQLSAYPSLLQHDHVDSVVTGILRLPASTALVASRPIVTSRYEGPIAGTLIMGRYLDAAQIAEVSYRTRLEISLGRPDDTPPDADFQQALAALSSDQPIFIQPAHDQTISGYFLLNDLAGDPALIIRVDSDRSIYQRGQDTLGYLVLSVTFVGVLIGAIILFILEKNVLARLSALTQSVWTVGRSGDRSARVSLPHGEDELWQLAITINEMLESLQHSETQLHQSKVLLQEVHHRIKNNLQVISSLLTLQALSINDDRVVQLLNDSQHRIEAIALVHDKLYSTTRLSLVDVGEYTRSLIDKLKASMISANSVHVSVKADPMILEVDRAVPIGLILSELITNALKYAFPNGKPGEISIELRAIGDEQYTIIVRDNGVGFPEDLDIHQATSLGLQLVTGLTKQLDGTVEVRRERGTIFEITFASAAGSEGRR